VWPRSWPLRSEGLGRLGEVGDGGGGLVGGDKWLSKLVTVLLLFFDVPAGRTFNQARIADRESGIWRCRLSAGGWGRGGAREERRAVEEQEEREE